MQTKGEKKKDTSMGDCRWVTDCIPATQQIMELVECSLIKHTPASAKQAKIIKIKQKMVTPIIERIPSESLN